MPPIAQKRAKLQSFSMSQPQPFASIPVTSSVKQKILMFGPTVHMILLDTVSRVAAVLV